MIFPRVTKLLMSKICPFFGVGSAGMLSTTRTRPTYLYTCPSGFELESTDVKCFLLACFSYHFHENINFIGDCLRT